MRNHTRASKEILDAWAAAQSQPERAVVGLQLKLQSEESAASTLEKQPLESLVRERRLEGKLQRVAILELLDCLCLRDD